MGVFSLKFSALLVKKTGKMLAGPSYHYGKYGGALTLHATGGRKVWYFGFLCITKFWNDRVCANSITVKQVEFRNDSDKTRWMFAVVHLRSTWSLCCKTAPSQWKYGQIWGFCLKGITIQNLVKLAVFCPTWATWYATQRGRWPVRAHHVITVMCHIWHCFAATVQFLSY